MRRSLLVAALLLILLGVAVGVYFFFFAGGAKVAIAPSGAPSATGTAGLPAGGTLPVISTPETPVRVTARLVRIDAGPVVPGEAAVDVALLPSGAVATSSAKNASTTPDVAVRYIERESGNVFSYLVRAGILTRTSNKTVPRIQTALWLPDASAAIVQYLSGDTFSTINTYSLPASSQGGQTGFFLPQNLSEIAASPAGLLLLASGVNGSAASVVRTDGTHAAQAFTTPLSSLRAFFAGKGYFAFTKPSSTLAGDAYLIDNSGTFSRVAGPLYGLTALASPSGKFVLVSSVSGGTLKMSLVTVSTGDALALPVATIADKCVWAADDSAVYCGIPTSVPSGYAYPDDWYQGAVHFSDRIWKIDVSGRYAQLVLDFSQAQKGAPLDATALALDPAGTVLVFLNKNDGSLWSYAL